MCLGKTYFGLIHWNSDIIILLTLGCFKKIAETREKECRFLVVKKYDIILELLNISQNYRGSNC